MSATELKQVIALKLAILELLSSRRANRQIAEAALTEVLRDQHEAVNQQPPPANQQRRRTRKGA